MDDKLEAIIRKHAAKQGIEFTEAVKIYKDYNKKINILVDELDTNNIKEIRVPWLMRFVFNEKKYEKIKTAQLRKAEKNKESQS
jgi:hypothetical protein